MSKATHKTTSLFTKADNINLLWSVLFVEELVRNGITDFCIAPGSRSTPLTLAVANRSDVNSHLHFDERGLGFLALGIASEKKQPVVIISTSGTAVANLYPAIIEARQSAVPLIVISADRPPELLDCGANQAINQYGIFSNYPVYFKQIPTPTDQITPNYLLSTLDHGLACQQKQQGPIHFNIPFQAPLYPTESRPDYQSYLAPINAWLKTETPFTSHAKNNVIPALQSNLAHKKTLIIVGQLTSLVQAKAITQFSQNNHYPMFADIQSSLVSQPNNIAYYDLLLTNPTFREQVHEADLIIQFGDKLISKGLNQFITKFSGEYWLIQRGNQHIDPNHRLTQRIDCEPIDWISTQTQINTDSNLLSSLKAHDQRAAELISSHNAEKNLLSEINIVRCLDKKLISNAPLFIGNSMPVRICDMFMHQTTATIYTNRGASGIDGLIATATGVAASSRLATTLLLGDTSFLYDLNSLALLKQLNKPFVIIVINNDGGAIFNLLPVPAQHKCDFYQLPHGLTFAEICKQFSIDYYQPKNIDEYENNYQISIKKHLSLIEICVKNEQTSLQLQQLKEHIQNATL